MRQSPQQRAKLRVCASCEWIFEGDMACPKCDFGSYGARYVYGNKAYRYKLTQRPWFDKKIATYAVKLNHEIAQSLDKTSKAFLLYKQFGAK